MGDVGLQDTVISTAFIRSKQTMAEHVMSFGIESATALTDASDQ